MGLALDGLKDGDETVTIEGMPVMLTKDVAGIIRSYGGLTIDYSDSMFYGKGFKLTLNRAGSC
jgi:hypothetical protein